MPKASEHYEGPVVFVDGVHYPVDDEGHADLKRPLRFVEGKSYRAAEKDEPLHNELNPGSALELPVGSE